MNVLSLFDGMSCGRIALERAGIHVTNYYASEIDKHAIKVSLKNYPNIIHVGSVTGVEGWQFPKIDLLIGGSPCQGFSSAGKGLNFDDPRSKLFFEYVRILKELKEINPDVKFLLENVKMPEEHLNTISEYLGVKPLRINSALVSAQNRERYYWTNISGIKIPTDKGIFLKDICECHSGHLTGEVESIWEEIRKRTKRCVGITFHPNGNIRPYQIRKQGIGELTLICHTDNKCNSIVKSHAPKVYTGEPFHIRNLTQTECERLQTVPDGYTKSLSYNQAVSCLGNGWTVDVIAHIFKELNNDWSEFING